MKRFGIPWLVALLSLLVLLCSPSHDDELDMHLRFLEPLLNKQWVGGFVGSEHPNMKIVRRFEWMRADSVVQCAREVKTAGFWELMHIRWDPARGEVSYLSENNSGMFEQGVVQAKEGRIIFHGENFCSSSTFEFQTTLEIAPHGTLRETRAYMKDGKWVQLYTQEFVAKR